MKKVIALCLLVPVFLTSCGTPKAVEVTPPKTPFIVETYSIGKKMESYTVEKSARLTAASALTLVTDSAGEITTISVKEGQKISKGQRLVTLKDTLNSYDIRLAQAKNGLTTQNASVQATTVSLDKAIADTQNAYEQSKRSYDTLLAKNPLIYDSLVNTNQKTIDNLDASYQVYLADLTKNMDQILFESDKILGLSSATEYANDNWEPYLGARRGDLKAISDQSYAKAWQKLAEFRSGTARTMTPENANTLITELESGHALLKAHLEDMITMLQNNVIGGGLSQAQSDGWVAAYNNLRSLEYASNTNLTTWKTSTLTFLKNYKNNEQAIKVALESIHRTLTPDEEALINSSKEAKLLYDQNIIDLKDRIKAAELSLRQAENARDTAVKTKEATLIQLGASRNTALLSIDQAERDYSKLSVVAPFDGTVTKVTGSIGQRTNMGTPVVEVVSNNPEVVVDLDAEIAAHLMMNDTIQVRVGKNTFDGVVTAVSHAAGANLLYSTRISVPQALKYIGSAATLVFKGTKEVIDNEQGMKNIILPLKSVKIISEQEGQIVLYESGGTLTYKSVHLGKVNGWGVEILDTLDPTVQVVLSDVENFDPSKNILTQKK